MADRPARSGGGIKPLRAARSNSFKGPALTVRIHTSGALKGWVAATYPLEEIVAAHEHVEYFETALSG